MNVPLAMRSRFSFAPPGVFAEDARNFVDAEESSDWQSSSAIQTVWRSEDQTWQVLGPYDEVAYFLKHPNVLTSAEYIASDSRFRELPPGSFERFSQPIDPKIVSHLHSLVRLAYVPMRWKEQGVLNPSERCRETSLRILKDVYADYGLLPTRVVASRQEGIVAVYRDAASGRSLAIEIDNELDAVAVVSDDKSVMAAGVFVGDDISRLIDHFAGELAESTCH